MVLDPYSAAFAVGGSVLGGLLGNQQSSGDYAEALRLQKDLLQQYKDLQTPSVDDLKVYLQQYQNQGDYTPEELQAVGTLAATELGSIATDPRLAAYQQQALSDTSELAKTGMSAVDKAQLAEMLNKTNADQMAAQKAVLQGRASRGMAGSGDELAAALGGTQSAANRNSAEALQIAAQAAQRRAQATQDTAKLASTIESSDYNRQSAKAQAQDVINKFNANLRQGVAETNVANRNTAQQKNLSNKQSIANSNIDLTNKQNSYNTGLSQQDYENKLKKLQGMSGVSGSVSRSLNDRGDSTAKAYATGGSGIGTLLGYLSQGGAFKGASAEPGFTEADFDNYGGSGTTGSKRSNEF